MTTYGHCLWHGRYRPPTLRRGDRATCLYRDADVIVIGWSDARISWPRCRRPDTHGGGSGLLIDEELARAVRCESVKAICHWWGVNYSVVWKWRKALGVPRFNEGSGRLQATLNATKAARLKGQRLPPDQVERRRRTALELGLRPVPRYVNGRPWTEQVTGRGIPTACDRRRKARAER
jgi:hypothetical protein